MEVILLDKVENLGSLGDKVKVRPGYARNFLIPKGKAKYATAANLAEFEARRADLEKAAADLVAAAEARREKLDGAQVNITAKSGTEGKLFGSVGTLDIAEAFKVQGIELEKREIRMPDGAIRQAGEYEFAVHLHSDVNATIKVNVIGEE